MKVAFSSIIYERLILKLSTDSFLEAYLLQGITSGIHPSRLLTFI